MNIEGTIEVISNSSNTGDIIAIVVAVISIIGSIIVVILNNRVAKKISNENNDIQKKINEENVKLQDRWHKESLALQEKINTANIDANLIATARIEWIQKVRDLSAELISLYFMMLNSNDKDKIQVAFNNSIEKTELMILFFGHEDVEVEQNVSVLLNKVSNTGKNELIVDFLIRLSDKFNKYNTNVQHDGFTRLEDAVKRAQQEMYKNVKVVEVDEYWCEDSDQILPITDVELRTEDILKCNELSSELKYEKEKIKNLQDDIILLRNIIRIYLKIEWNKAKSAK